MQVTLEVAEFMSDFLRVQVQNRKVFSFYLWKDTLLTFCLAWSGKLGKYKYKIMR